MYIFALATRRANNFCSERRLWSATITSAPPEVYFDDVMSGTSLKGMAELTSKIACNGYIYLVDRKLTLSSVNMDSVSLPARQKLQRLQRNSWNLLGLYETPIMGAFTISSRT
jgi:hypothetical protein